MPMTRAEKDQMEALRIKAAFNWPPPAPPPITLGELAAMVGPRRNVVPLWSYNTYTAEVKQGCSNGIHHSKNDANRTTTQTAGGPWFHTEADAYRALHVEKAMEFAKALANLERRVAEDVARQSEPSA